MTSSESVDAGKGPPRVGSYRLIKPLGAGGMSSVFHAMHVDTGHEVAVKILPRTLAKNPTLLQRFLREAVNAEALEHPNIAAIYDRGLDGGRHYLVLEYVEGGDLHERIRASGPLDVREATRSIRSVAEGLDYALGRGVIHRDIKPANLLMTPQGQLKIIDLGLALQTIDEDERVTRDGTTVGTVDYMAPEQARDSRATSLKSDIYSLGCTFYFLLTGAPPFPGGDIPNKLGRHVAAPIPDVRELRPEVSEPLARLIQRMMAKKPDARFPGYGALIAAIDELPESSGKVPDALIAEDDDDDEEDDNEADVITLTVASPASSKPSAPPAGKGGRPREEAERGPSEISLADLAALDEDEPRQARGRTRSSPSPSPTAASPYDTDVDQPSSPQSVRSSTREVPLSTWIAAGAVLGLALALLGYGVLQVLSPVEGKVQASSGSGERDEGSSVPEFAPPPVTVRKAPEIVAKKKKATPAPAELPPEWKEPIDLVVKPPAETVYPSDVEQAILPEWMRGPIPASIEGPSVTLRRVLSSGDEKDSTSLRPALDKNGGIVEIADNGPFFVDDFRIAGKSRIIRARAGFRPMIKIDPPALSVARERPAVIPLDGSKLILEGLDLVVDARALPPTQTALFLLRGAELTISHCTLTVLNATGRAFSLVRAEDPGEERVVRVSRVRIENSLIRGAAPSVFDLQGPADIALVRSLVLAPGESIALERAMTARGERRISFVRSILATRGSVVELAGGRAPVVQFRALGSTFAKVAGLDNSGLIRSRLPFDGPPTSALDWAGRDNAFVGWPSWLAVDPSQPLIAGLTEARETWRSIEASSREERRGWPGRAIDEMGPPRVLQGNPEATAAILARVAAPEPVLLDATVGSIERLPVPEVAKRPVLAPAAADFGRPTSVGPISNRLSDPPRTGRSPNGPVPPASAGASSDNLTFDTADPEWRGDLGQFVGSWLRPGTTNVRVKVRGGGSWPMTPIRLPPGVSLEIDSTGAGATWYPLVGSTATALIESNGGDVSLIAVSLRWSASARVPRLVQVVDAHLYMSRCVLRSGEAGMRAGTGLVLFRAPGTRPLPRRNGPFLSSTEFPTFYAADSIFSANAGEAIGAELGRGVVSLVNSAILSEGDGTAIALRPQHVARDRFEADLVLDHCSIAAERTHVRIGPWRGSEPGPSRPWLVASTRCAFFEVAPRGRRDSVLLRGEGDALAHGALFWQANGDAYDLVHFTASAASTPAPVRFPNIRLQWIELWGSKHIVNVLGPNPKNADPSESILLKDRLRPGGLNVDDLKLDAKEHPDVGVDLRLLPVGTGR